MEKNESAGQLTWKKVLEYAAKARNADPYLPLCSIDVLIEVYMESLGVSQQQAIEHVKKLYPDIFTS